MLQQALQLFAHCPACIALQQQASGSVQQRIVQLLLHCVTWAPLQQ